ncbi:major facilitator superfamily domain-containing protein [Stachybotrys elegans]|uniref:Major facilitator superfamily domain-containing protein n=1 Tax=Stachybotrys elegans TaxID=80388 RepID=A0A8K0SIG7_9HYPO|nr:major facilitator superfamily domain-containing protein [Stachybotrys elegans]
MDAKQVISGPMHDEPTAPDKQQTAASAASAPVSLGGEAYPEGGLSAWVVVLGSWLAMFTGMGIMNTIPIFHSYTHTHQLRDHRYDTIGWIYSIYTFLAFACGIYIGPIFDKYGPKWLLAAGTASTTAGMLCMSFSHDLWHFILSFGLLCGLGTSLIFTPSIAAVGHWFKARRSFATGIASTAGSIGGIVYPLMLSSLFERVGFAWATRVLALLCLVCGALGILLVRSRLPPAVNAKAQPDFRIFRQVPFLLTSMGIFMMEFALFIPLTYISSYAIAQGFSSQFAFNLVAILNAASALGRAVPGYYGDFLGPFNVCILAVAMCIVSILCVWLPSGHTTAGIILFTVLWGFGGGTNISMSPVCVGMLCKTQEYGRYYATCYTLVSIACLIGIPIGGAILRVSDGDYAGLIIFTAIIYALSAGFLFAAKIAKLGWKGWRAVF